MCRTLPPAVAGVGLAAPLHRALDSEPAGKPISDGSPFVRARAAWLRRVERTA